MTIRKGFENQKQIRELLAKSQQKAIELSKRQAELERQKELNEGVPYEVRKGDNLTNISKATGISIHDLAKDNNIKDIDKINAGDTIFFKIHHKPEDAINSDSMNEDFPDMRFQGYYLDEVEDRALEKYHKVSDEGAQKYLEDNN